MRISYVVTECRDKVSPNCTKTFKRKVQRGRPAVNCTPCKEFKVPSAVPAAESHDCNSEGWDCMFNNGVKEHNKKSVTERECPCGNKFHIKLGRGRKATKCDSCRSNGTVYRMNEDGELDAIRAETLAEEQREIREQNGQDRARRLVEMMAPLIARDAKRRTLVAS